MAKTKKLLCLAVAVALVSSLFCLPASATANWSHIFDMSAMMGAGSYGRHGSTTTTDYNVAGVYGKSTDGVLKLNATAETADYYLGLSGSKTLYAFTANSKTVISYDVAFDSLDATGNNHVSLMQFANATGGQIAQLNLVQITKGGQVNPLDKGYIATSVKPGCWNNITAVIDLGSDSKTYTCTIYLNGVSVQSTTGTLSTETAYVRALRICDRTVGGTVYIDNLKFASYPAADTVNLNFVSQAATTDAAKVAVNTANNTVAITDADLKVAEFKNITTGFVVLGEDGAVAADDASILDSEIYAVYVNDVNSYYAPYTISVIPPVITGSTTVYQEIINNDTKEIRVVDMPKLTVGTFKDNVTNTGTLSITKNGEAAADSDLLKDCTVNLTLGSYYDYTYTVVTERSYLLKKETFDGTFTTRTSGNGTVYSGNGFVWAGNTNGISGVTFGELTGLGGKDADDSSFGITVNGASADQEIFTYISNPYINSSKVINTTHTLETKIYLDDVDAADFSAIDFCINGRNLLKISPDGSIKHTDGTVATGVKWTAGEWIPVAVTYHKATNIIDVYVGGKKIACTWNPAPNGSDIRFRPWVKKDAVFTFAMDDVKIYTDSLAKVRYDVDSANRTVVADATENLATLPIIAEYDSTGKLLGVTLGKSEKTISRNYAADSKVKVILINSLAELEAITDVYEAVR